MVLFFFFVTLMVYDPFVAFLGLQLSPHQLVLFLPVNI